MPTKFTEVTLNFDHPDPKNPNIGIHKIDVEEWEVVEISMHMVSRELKVKMRENKDRKRKRGPKGKYQKGWMK